MRLINPDTQGITETPDILNFVVTAGVVTAKNSPKHSFNRAYAPPMLPKNPYTTETSVMLSVWLVLRTRPIFNVCVQSLSGQFVVVSIYPD